jgi:hypothetical protein
MIDEVVVDVVREEHQATLTLRWRGGAITEGIVPLARHQPKIRTDEDTLALMRRLAVHYDDATMRNRARRRPEAPRSTAAR